MILNIACLTRKPTTRESRSEYLNDFSSAIMKHRRLIWKYDTLHIFYQRWSNKHQHNQMWHQTWSWLMITYTFIEFQSCRVGRVYLISEHPHIYGKQGYLNNKYKVNSSVSSRRIKNQRIKQTVLKWVLWMSGPHQSPSWFCMNWFYEFHCLESWSLFMLA